MRETVKQLVEEAGRRAVAYFEGTFEVMTKEDGSPVTTADLDLNEFLCDGLRNAFPDDAIVSEEGEPDPRRFKAKRVWFIDPIDGTSYFAQRKPEFATLIGLCEDGASILSVVHFPLLNLTVEAARGEGALVNGRQTTVSSVQGGEAKILTRGKKLMGLGTVQRKSGHPALEFVRVAGGELEAFAVPVNPRAGEHDYAWLPCAVEEAGGRVTDGHGAPIRFNREEGLLPGYIVASNGLVHEEVLEQLPRD